MKHCKLFNHLCFVFALWLLEIDCLNESGSWMAHKYVNVYTCSIVSAIQPMIKCLVSYTAKLQWSVQLLYGSLWPLPSITAAAEHRLENVTHTLLRVVITPAKFIHI